MKSSGVLMIVAIPVLLLASPTHAEIYKWVDKDGVVHFQDTPPAGAGPAMRMPEVPAGVFREEGQRVEESAGKEAPAAGKAAPPPPGTSPAGSAVKLRQDAKVEIYGTSWCPYCKSAREFFRTRGIAFEEYDVEKDLEAMRRKKELDPDGGVPTTVIDGQVIHGFSAEAYEKALAAPN